jgi:Ni,Fe-hydrogenase I small subunit
MSRPVQFSPGQARSESQVVHVLWMTSLLGCDGDSMALTSATSPSLEDLLYRTIPGTPGVAIYHPVLAFETGDSNAPRTRTATAPASRTTATSPSGTTRAAAWSSSAAWALS